MTSHFAETPPPPPLGAALLLRVDWPEGDGLSLRAGGRCSGGVVTEARPKPSCFGFTGQGETGYPSVPLITPQEGLSLRGG